MKKIASLSLAVALATASTSAFAAEGAGFVRAEAGVSRATTHVQNGGYDDDDSNAYGIRGGYYFTKHFAVEGFYTRYYDENFDGVDLSAKGFGAGIVGKTHFNESDTGFYADGRIGLARTKLEADVSGVGSTDQSNTRAYLGAGVGYDFTPDMGLSLNYLYHDGIDIRDSEAITGSNVAAKFETLTLGFEYRF